MGYWILFLLSFMRLLLWYWSWRLGIGVSLIVLIFVLIEGLWNLLCLIVGKFRLILWVWKFCCLNIGVWICLNRFMMVFFLWIGWRFLFFCLLVLFCWCFGVLGFGCFLNFIINVGSVVGDVDVVEVIIVLGKMVLFFWFEWEIFRFII